MSSWLEADATAFRQEFDLSSFAFSHKLATHPLFAPHRVLGLAKQLAGDPRDVYFDAGPVSIDQRWDQTPICDASIEDLMTRIETAGAWIVLRRAEKDPEYAALLDECMAEIEALSGRDLSKIMKLRNAIIFINSPHRISTYHIDRECNCLLQIRGSKTLSVFDRNDREVLPEEEIERFWTVDNNAARYRAEFADRARTFELTPGSAVHIPVNSPHWVRNGPEVSVSLSVNFHYRDALLADVYRANYWLRRAGLKPAPPQRAPAVAKIKSAVYGAARTVRATAASSFGRGSS